MACTIAIRGRQNGNPGSDKMWLTARHFARPGQRIEDKNAEATRPLCLSEPRWQEASGHFQSKRLVSGRPAHQLERVRRVVDAQLGRGRAILHTFRPPTCLRCPTYWAVRRVELLPSLAEHFSFELFFLGVEVEPPVVRVVQTRGLCVWVSNSEFGR